MNRDPLLAVQVATPIGSTTLRSGARAQEALSLGDAVVLEDGAEIAGACMDGRQRSRTIIGDPPTLTVLEELDMTRQFLIIGSLLLCLAAFAMAGTEDTARRHQLLCQDNLLRIDSAVQQYMLEMDIEDLRDVIEGQEQILLNDLAPSLEAYLPSAPTCPDHGAYTIFADRGTTQPVTCSFLEPPFPHTYPQGFFSLCENPSPEELHAYCQSNMWNIDSAVKQYILETEVSDLVALLGGRDEAPFAEFIPVLVGTEAFLRHEPLCPEGGAYILSGDETTSASVRCTFQEPPVPHLFPFAQASSPTVVLDWRGEPCTVGLAAAFHDCQEEMVRLDSAIWQYLLEHDLTDFEDLLGVRPSAPAEEFYPLLVGQDSYLRHAPLCPYGGAYRIHDNGPITCSWQEPPVPHVYPHGKCSLTGLPTPLCPAEVELTVDRLLCRGELHTVDVPPSRETVALLDPQLLDLPGNARYTTMTLTIVDPAHETDALTAQGFGSVTVQGNGTAQLTLGGPALGSDFRDALLSVRFQTLDQNVGPERHVEVIASNGVLSSCPDAVRVRITGTSTNPHGWLVR